MIPYSDHEICDRIFEAFEGQVLKGECSPRVDIPRFTYLRNEIEEFLEESGGLSALDDIMEAIENWSQDISAECDGADPEIGRGADAEIMRLVPKIRRMCAGEEFVP